jgi:hypothetical protein
MTTRESAERALEDADWVTAELYVRELFDSETAPAVLWLERLREAASRSASQGDNFAVGLLGNVELIRWQHGLAPVEDALGAALQHFMRASRQPGGEPMIEQVRHWYGQAKDAGLRFAEVEAFLSDSDVRDRFEHYFGTTL